MIVDGNKYGCQRSIPRPLKGTGLCNRLFLWLGASPVTQQSSVLMSLTLFLRSVSFRSEMSSRVMAVLKSHPQRSITCKYQNIGKSSFSITFKPKESVFSFEERLYNQLCSYCIKNRSFIGKLASVQVGFQPVNIASLTSKMM